MNANLSEAETRAQLIDHQLAQAGWAGSRTTLVEELLLAPRGSTRVVRERSSNFVDYALLNDDGAPIAIVEAKRTSRDEIAGKRQASDYAKLIKDQYGVEPFIFLTNGLKPPSWAPGMVRWANRASNWKTASG
jgi:type I restriction enzyme, R subunit